MVCLTVSLVYINSTANFKSFILMRPIVHLNRTSNIILLEIYNYKSGNYFAFLPNPKNVFIMFDLNNCNPFLTI